MMLRWLRGRGGGVCGRRRRGFSRAKEVLPPILCGRATGEEMLNSLYNFTGSEERILFLNIHRCD